jgi:DUF2891 family protein
MSVMQFELKFATASSFAKLGLRCLKQEYPNKPDHVMYGPSEVQSPRTQHPAFYGAFDWHSSVHGHWMLIRLLRQFPELPKEQKIRRLFNANLTPSNIKAEVRYFDSPKRKTFERTYGWAWLLKLAEELHGWQDPDANRWSSNLSPLTKSVIKRYRDFLPRQTYPIRTGVHANTAFGLAFALDYAQAAKLPKFKQELIKHARRYFEKDRNVPIAWEPGGEDFFSPALLEADLMRRVLPSISFGRWFNNFLPELKNVSGANLLKPAIVADRTDSKIVHLDGLNLSRAWCLMGILVDLPKKYPGRDRLLESAHQHLSATLPHVMSGNYEGEHWLATFAVYSLSQPTRFS